jgi:hypothetical protein
MATMTETQHATGPYVDSTDRPDCPGKIVCPLTGDVICADQCPLDEAREVSLAVADAPPCCCDER